jgi:hypothetical protein
MTTDKLTGPNTWDNALYREHNCLQSASRSANIWRKVRSPSWLHRCPILRIPLRQRSRTACFLPQGGVKRQKVELDTAQGEPQKLGRGPGLPGRETNRARPHNGRKITASRPGRDYEEKWMVVRDITGGGGQNSSSVLKVPRHCPFVLLVSASI